MATVLMGGIVAVPLVLLLGNVFGMGRNRSRLD